MDISQCLENRKWRVRIAILVVIVAVTILYIINKKPNPEIGHWTTPSSAYKETLNIYDDGVASYNGYKCTWKELSKSTLRLQCSVRENKLIYEFKNGDLKLGDSDTFFTKTQ